MRQLAIIIPTLNASKHLPRCLASIRAQTHFHKVSIIVVDGGSSDRSIDNMLASTLAYELPIYILHNPLGYAEHGKLLGTQKALSLGCDYIMYMDADNELASSVYVQEAIACLESYEDVALIECIAYDPGKVSSSFNTYLTTCLRVADPLMNFLIEDTDIGNTDGEYYNKTKTYHYPTGANCCVFRAEDIRYALFGIEQGISIPLQVKDLQFEDTIIALRILRRYDGLFIRLPGYYHYTAQNIWQFIQKRRRQTRHYLNTPRSPEDSCSWLPSRWKILLGVLYCLSVVGPCNTALYNMIKYYDGRWLWHPLACVTSILGLIWGILTPRNKDERTLQPKH
jgi:glycosyltransferase involved in cell wall biosynthesis